MCNRLWVLGPPCLFVLHTYLYYTHTCTTHSAYYIKVFLYILLLMKYSTIHLVFQTVSVATHEIGHILGLQHSTDVNAVMYPFLNFGMTKRELSHDDIDGMLALYGTP